MSSRPSTRNLGPWFRVYTSILNDKKLARLNDAQFRSWFHLMALAKDEDGAIPEELADIAHALRKPIGKIRDLIQVFVSAGLLEQRDNHLIPHNWSERQFLSDVSSDRVRKFREQSKSSGETPNEADMKRFRSADATANETPPEAEAEAEAEHKDTPSLRSGVARAARPKAPKRSIPENFPDEVSKKWAESHWLEKGRADLCGTMDEEIAKFRDRQAAQNGSYADWPAAWRTWCRNAMNFSKQHRNGNGKLTGHQAFAAAALSIVREAESRERDFEDAGST